MRNKAIDIAYQYAINGNIGDITLVKLADDLSVSRRSLYRVFTGKNDLLFEVYKRMVKELLNDAHCLNYNSECELKSNDDKSCLTTNDLSCGYSLVENGIKNMINVFIMNPNKIKYITMYDSIPNKPDELLIEQNDFYRKCDFTYKFLLVGIKDGSIRSDLDAYKTSCIILETVIGFMARYIDLSNENFSSYMGPEDLCMFISMIMNYIK